jgi:hypothetical protein
MSAEPRRRQSTLEKAMNAWKNTRHNANMLQSAYVYVGVTTPLTPTAALLAQEFAYELPKPTPWISARLPAADPPSSSGRR